MRAIVLGLAVIATSTFGQDLDRTFYFTHTDTTQQLMEVGTTIRTIADIQQVSADSDQKSLTVHATAPQIAMAEWLFNELDSPIAQPSVRTNIASPAAPTMWFGCSTLLPPRPSRTFRKPHLGAHHHRDPESIYLQ